MITVRCKGKGSHRKVKYVLEPVRVSPRFAHVFIRTVKKENFSGMDTNLTLSG